MVKDNAETKEEKRQRNLLRKEKKRQAEETEKADESENITNDETRKKAKIDQAENQIAAKPSRDVQKWFEEHQIFISDKFTSTEWKPFLAFSDTKLSAKVLHGTSKFSAPTPIQR